MNVKTIMITGGAGFIGSNLCEKLLKLNYSVVCVDNLISGRESNIRHLYANKAFEFINYDVINPLLYDKPLFAVYHLASPASVPDYQNYPVETALVNSIGTRNMLDLVKRTNARFVYASTSEIYGDPLEHPQKETYWGNVNPNGIRACYDESKRFGEMITMVYHRLYNVDTRIMRIFNTYGPRMRKTDGRVVSNFINQALKGKPLTIYGDGNQTRSFCYIDDLITGLVALMEINGLGGEVINLGNPEEYTVKELSEKILSLLKIENEVKYEKLPKDDPRERRPDITKARTLLNWNPTTSLIQGLGKTIEYYRTCDE